MTGNDRVGFLIADAERMLMEARDLSRDPATRGHLQTAVQQVRSAERSHQRQSTQVAQGSARDS